MSKLKFVAPAVVVALSAFTILPAYADDYVLVGDPDELDHAATALSTVTLSSSEVSLAIGETQDLTVTYNEGFDVANIDEVHVVKESGTYSAFAGFNGEYVGEEYVYDYNSLYAYGSEIGSAVYSVTVSDVNGNEATTNLSITVREALGSGYANVEGECQDGDYDCVAYEAGADFGTPVEGGVKLGMELVPMTDVLAALDGNLNAVFDLFVLDKDGNKIPVADNEIEAWFGIRKDMLGELENADELYFQVVYIEDGAIVQFFDVEEIEDDGWGWMFTVKGITHFSDYGILVSTTPFDSAADRNALLAPNTGAFTATEEGVTVNYSGLIATVAIMTALLVAYKVVEYRKK